MVLAVVILKGSDILSHSTERSVYQTKRVVEVVTPKGPLLYQVQNTWIWSIPMMAWL